MGEQVQAQQFLEGQQVVDLEGAAQFVARQRAALVLEVVDGSLEVFPRGARLPGGERGAGAAGEATQLHRQELVHAGGFQSRVEQPPRLSDVAQPQQRLGRDRFRLPAPVHQAGFLEAGGGITCQPEGLHAVAAGQGKLGLRQRHGRHANAVVERTEALERRRERGLCGCALAGQGQRSSVLHAGPGAVHLHAQRCEAA